MSSRIVFSRILVATDGSATAARAVDRAADVACAHDASLTVLSVGEVGDESRAEEVTEAELARLADRGLRLESVVASGDAAATIVATAGAGGYDLVVVGNVGMTGPRRLFTIGTVPNKVSHALACSLLIVRTA